MKRWFAAVDLTEKATRNISSQTCKLKTSGPTDVFVAIPEGLSACRISGLWGSTPAAQSDRTVKRDVHSAALPVSAFFGVRPLCWKSMLIEMRECVQSQRKREKGAMSGRGPIYSFRCIQNVPTVMHPAAEPPERGHDSAGEAVLYTNPPSDS